VFGDLLSSTWVERSLKDGPKACTSALPVLSERVGTSVPQDPDCEGNHSMYLLLLASSGEARCDVMILALSKVVHGLFRSFGEVSSLYFRLSNLSRGS
jgi:hypothetical protein